MFVLGKRRTLRKSESTRRAIIGVRAVVRSERNEASNSTGRAGAETPNAPLTTITSREATMVTKDVIHFSFVVQLASRSFSPAPLPPKPVSESPP